MILQLQSFTALVRNQARNVQAASATTLDLTVGSTLRAILEAVAGTGLWLQKMALDVLRTTRLASSSGVDVDSYVGDFGLNRLPAVSASGQVTLSRYSPGQAAFVPVGTLLKTADGTLAYTVTGDASNPTWNGSTGYNLPATAASLVVPVMATTLGKGGNVAAGMISLLGTALAGIDTVNNSVALTNGLDAESDAALRTRFAAYIAALSRATVPAIRYAVSSVQAGLAYKIVENTLPDGTARMGSFVVVVDDGSGTPSASLLSSVYAAVDQYRPLGSSFAVIAPTVVPVTVSLTVSVVAGASAQAAQANVSTALTAYINALPVGSNLSYLRLAQVAQNADPSIVQINSLLLQGGTADLTATVSTSYKVNNVAVS